MIGISRRGVGVGLAALAAAGCSGERLIHENSNYPIPPNARGLTPEQLDRVMYEAATARGWRMERRGAGQFRGTLARTSYSIWVDLLFDRENYRFVFEPASELQKSGPGMQQEYMRLIYYMKSDIDARLQAVRS